MLQYIFVYFFFSFFLLSLSFGVQCSAHKDNAFWDACVRLFSSIVPYSPDLRAVFVLQFQLLYILISAGDEVCYIPCMFPFIVWSIIFSCEKFKVCQYYTPFSMSLSRRVLLLLPPLFGFWSSVLCMFIFNDVLFYLNFPPPPPPPHPATVAVFVVVVVGCFVAVCK